MRRQLPTALGILLMFTVLTGLIYPLVTTGVAQVAFNDQANGSLVDEDGTVVGSSLIAQAFTSPEYFHPRPSAAGDDGYDAMASSGTNYGPTNPELLDSIESLATAYRTENGLADDAEVPVDAVTSSGSGLDPAISEENARLQAPRVAEARGLEVDKVLGLVDDHTTSRALGVLGEPVVNVLELNFALDNAR